MLSLTLANPQQPEAPLARVTLPPGAPPLVEGMSELVNLDAPVYSAQYGQPITCAHDPEAWLRALAAELQANPAWVVRLEDSSPLADPNAQAVAAFGQPGEGAWASPLPSTQGGFPSGPGMSPLVSPGEPAGALKQEDKTWAVLTHLSIFLVPFLGPLLIMLLPGKESPFVEAHAKESLNFHITMFILGFVCAFLILILIGIPLLIALLIFSLVMPIIAAVTAGQGRPYRYPLTIHFLK